MKEILVVLKDGINLYYLLKVVRSGFDVYCIPPHLGIHFSLHESGESHFKFEGKVKESEEQPPLALVMGEAGKPIDRGIIRAPLKDLGRASGICTAIYSITALSEDFQEFHQGVTECFVIDKELLSTDTKGLVVGIWAVPDRNKISFTFNNPNIPENLLYKDTKCDPQIWIYARPS